MIAAVSRQACEAYNEVYGSFLTSLGGMCGLASHFLFNNLRNEGYNPKFIMATAELRGSHCWIAVGNVNIDITATQFDPFCSPVYNYNGKMEDHPLLVKLYKHDRVFPSQWFFQETDKHKDIAIMMEGWGIQQSYRGLTRKRLDNFYKMN